MRFIFKRFAKFTKGRVKNDDNDDAYDVAVTGLDVDNHVVAAVVKMTPECIDKFILLI
jgi:hypothetical protein